MIDIINYRNGKLFQIRHIIDDLCHNESGPAIQQFYENGQLEYKEYWINNKLHRLDGPARLWYNESGILDLEQFWFNGELYDSLKELQRAAKLSSLL